MRTSTTVVDVSTPLGPGRLHLDAAVEAVATLALGHGAGGGVGSADLLLLARTLPPLGVNVARFEQPWRTAGRRVAVPPAQLDIGWRSAVAQLTETTPAPRLFFGGRSAGARVACRTAEELAADGVVCLAFPLHPPGRPEKSRLGELLEPAVPRLVLQGSRDSFGNAVELAAALGGSPGVRVVELPGADHSFKVANGTVDGTGKQVTTADLRSTIANEVAAFLLS